MYIEAEGVPAFKPFRLYIEAYCENLYPPPAVRIEVTPAFLRDIARKAAALKAVNMRQGQFDGGRHGEWIGGDLRVCNTDVVISPNDDPDPFISLDFWLQGNIEDGPLCESRLIDFAELIEQAVGPRIDEPNEVEGERSNSWMWVDPQTLVYADSPADVQDLWQTILYSWQVQGTPEMAW